MKRVIILNVDRSNVVAIAQSVEQAERTSAWDGLVIATTESDAYEGYPPPEDIEIVRG